MASQSSDATELRVDQYFPHPPAKVWRALIEPGLIARWLMPGDFRLETGHRYRMRAIPMPSTGFSGTVEAEVLGFTEEKSLTVRWRDASGGGNPSAFTLTWTLEPEGHGTRLFLTQTGFDPDDPRSRRARDIMSGGWTSRVFPGLATVLDEIP